MGGLYRGSPARTELARGGVNRQGVRVMGRGVGVRSCRGSGGGGKLAQGEVGVGREGGAGSRGGVVS